MRKRVIFISELSIKIQEVLGADIIMSFDECPATHSKKYLEDL